MRELHKAHSASDGNSNESWNHQDEWGSSQMTLLMQHKRET